MAESSGELRPNWVVRSSLTETKLLEYIAQYAVGSEQVIAITEPKQHFFTLIYEATPEQYQRDLEARPEREERAGPFGLQL
jgi:hypothetical protein